MNRPAFPIRVAGVVLVLALLVVILVVPAGALPSRHQDEPTPRDTATAAPTFTPTPTQTPTATAAPAPYIELDPSQAYAGSRVTTMVRGFQFPPGGTIALYWDVLDADHRLTDAFLANGEGRFRIEARIKRAWATVGTHTIWAHESNGALASAEMILLPAPPSDTPTPETPTTTFTPSPTLRPVTPMVTITPFPPTKAPPPAATRTSTPVPGTATATRTPTVTPTPSNTPGPGTPSATPLTEAAQPTATPEDQISDTGGGWGMVFLWGFILAGLLVVFRLLRVRSLQG